MFTPTKQVAEVRTLPSPTGGLNVYDNLATMPAVDAVVLNNLVAQPYGCMVRKGYIQYSTGYPSSVDSIALFAKQDGSYKLYAWSNDSLFDATTSGAVGAALLTGLSNAWWNSITFANAAGVHMLSFNGVDDPIWITTAGVARITAGGGTSGTWSGVNPNTIVQATVHQRRVWGVQASTTYGWYLPADSVFGVANYFDFGPFFKRGGYLQALTTWTVDSGSGMDDKLVAISSQGEVAVFSGTDVSDSTKWALVGVFYIGTPVAGRRFFTNVAGDVYLLTLTGVVSLATLVTSTQVNLSSDNAYSKKIQYLISDLTADLGDLDGWQIEYFPAINLMFVNIPTVYYGGAGQVVNNYINGTWSTLQGMDAACWAKVDGSPYFGGNDGVLYKAWTGHKDGVLVDGSGGTNILSRAQTSYNYFDRAGLQKQIGMYRPNFLGTRVGAVGSRVLTDFETRTTLYPSGVLAAPGAASLWDVALWDDGIWSGGTVVQRQWQQATGMGVALSLELALSTDCEFTWVSTDMTLRAGGIF